MKTVIVFREGQSGNYLKSIILDSGLNGVGFRMPDNNKGSGILLTHNANYQEHMLQFDLVLRILPTKKIYSAIYNNFMKKLIGEKYSAVSLDNWHADPVFWYDCCYYNIIEYHDLITTDIQTNCYTNIIDFDQLLDKNYLNEILYKYCQIEFNDSRETIRRTYAELQLTIELDQDSYRMEDIVEVVSDTLLLKNPWFFSYCIHKYELANNFTPQNRLWSINNIDQLPTKQLLLSLAAQYS
tara:strand:- start:75 stop:794 length:720 start_codon:yes stop_codon:yes gene_type:complete